jgi:parvulin-like peptidyl-prolyl isomerase
MIKVPCPHAPGSAGRAGLRGPSGLRRARMGVWCAALCCGLLVAGAAGGAFAQTPAQAPPKEDNPVLATVNGHEIRLSDVYRRIESFSLGDQIDVRAQIDRFTNSMVTEEVLFQSVLTADFAGEEDLRRRVQEVVVEHMINKYVRSRIKVSDGDIRGYYKANRDLVRGLHVRVRQILLKSRPRCEETRKRILAGGDFAREAEAHSLDKDSAKSGGDVGLMMPVLGPDAMGFELELFKMSAGEMRIFESERGCHLVQVTEVIDPPDPSFEQVRAYVRPILEREREQELLQGLIEDAARGVRVERP